MRIGILLLTIFIAACADNGRYSQHTDSKPKYIDENIDFRDVTPRFEPYLAASLRPYTVLGKHYRPLKTAKGYEKTGIASWYGQKFHGHLTANGEVYNMFAMSAAHKTLPLPSFVRVTNLANGKQAIVRINDRGPFHQKRIIDLSYAAAMKIGVLDTGTAKVKVEVMHVDEQGTLVVGNQSPTPPQPTLGPATSQVASQAAPSQQIYIQVAALQDETKAQRLASGLQNQYKINATAPILDGLFRLRLGPLSDESRANDLLQKLRQDGFDSAFRVFTAP
ncbi:septal ring lytic transglycosylase RlpA family protein [Aliiglaciecola sp.]|nr:septal ring lytic transglycosylase RlpA family protein [Aliiglaciecola sp.]